MMCKRFIKDFRVDIKNWLWFLLSIIGLFIISYFENERDWAEASIYVVALVMLMSAVATIFDIFSWVFLREKVGFYWLVFAFVTFVSAVVLYKFSRFGINELVGLLIFSSGVALVLLLFFSKNQ